ncbi:MAG: hypothetical protein AABW67_00195, partial [Nanoarchaeota archaeon]
GQLRYIILLKLHNLSTREKNLFEFCKNHPNIIRINKILGEWDSEIHLEIKNHYEYKEIMSNLKNSFSDIIKWYSPLITYNFYKYNCLPMETI